MYFITSVCKDRTPRFADDLAARTAGFCLMDARTWPDARCLGWVLMPDHLHALILLGEKESLSLVMQRVKSLIAARVNQCHGTSHALWQKGFHDHALAAHAHIPEFARYLVNNPVQAELVENSGDYPHLWLDQTFL
ncbi:MAG: transposase [Arenimonas sp.]|nr:transposase [Arenimonas sp.]